MGFDYWTCTGLGKQTLGGHKQNLVCTPGPRRKEKWPHKRLIQICLWVSRSFQWRLGSAVAWCRIRGTECGSACMTPFEGRHRYLHYFHHSLASGQITGREHSLTHQQKIGLKIYWACPPSHQNNTRLPPQSVSPIRKLPQASYLYPSEARMKTTIRENWSNWSRGSQTSITQWNYEPCSKGPPKTDGSWWRVLIKCGPLEKGMANHFIILALRITWTVWKGEKMWHWKMNSPGWWGPNMLLEISGEITRERVKRQSQSENNAQLCLWLVMEVKSDAVKNNKA